MIGTKQKYEALNTVVPNVKNDEQKEKCAFCYFKKNSENKIKPGVTNCLYKISCDHQYVCYECLRRFKLEYGKRICPKCDIPILIKQFDSKEDVIENVLKVSHKQFTDIDSNGAGINNDISTESSIETIFNLKCVSSDGFLEETKTDINSSIIVNECVEKKEELKNLKKEISSEKTISDLMFSSEHNLKNIEEITNDDNIYIDPESLKNDSDNEESDSCEFSALFEEVETYFTKKKKSPDVIEQTKFDTPISTTSDSVDEGIKKCIGNIFRNRNKRKADIQGKKSNLSNMLEACENSENIKEKKEPIVEKDDVQNKQESEKSISLHNASEELFGSMDLLTKEYTTKTDLLALIPSSPSVEVNDPLKVSANNNIDLKNDSIQLTKTDSNDNCSITSSIEFVSNSNIMNPKSITISVSSSDLGQTANENNEVQNQTYPVKPLIPEVYLPSGQKTEDNILVTSENIMNPLETKIEIQKNNVLLNSLENNESKTIIPNYPIAFDEDDDDDDLSLNKIDYSNDILNGESYIRNKELTTPVDIKKDSEIFALIQMEPPIKKKLKLDNKTNVGNSKKTVKWDPSVKDTEGFNIYSQAYQVLNSRFNDVYIKIDEDNVDNDVYDCLSKNSFYNTWYRKKSRKNSSSNSSYNSSQEINNSTNLKGKTAILSQYQSEIDRNLENIDKVLEHEVNRKKKMSPTSSIKQTYDMDYYNPFHKENSDNSYGNSKTNSNDNVDISSEKIEDIEGDSMLIDKSSSTNVETKIASKINDNNDNKNSDNKKSLTFVESASTSSNRPEKSDSTQNSKHRHRRKIKKHLNKQSESTESEKKVEQVSENNFKEKDNKLNVYTYFENQNKIEQKKLEHKKKKEQREALKLLALKIKSINQASSDDAYETSLDNSDLDEFLMDGPYPSIYHETINNYIQQDQMHIIDPCEVQEKEEIEDVGKEFEENKELKKNNYEKSVNLSLNSQSSDKEFYDSNEKHNYDGNSILNNESIISSSQTEGEPNYIVLDIKKPLNIIKNTLSSINNETNKSFIIKKQQITLNKLELSNKDIKEKKSEEIIKREPEIDKNIQSKSDSTDVKSNEINQNLLVKDVIYKADLIDYKKEENRKDNITINKDTQKHTNSAEIHTNYKSALKRIEEAKKSILVSNNTIDNSITIKRNPDSDTLDLSCCRSHSIKVDDVKQNECIIGNKLLYPIYSASNKGNSATTPSKMLKEISSASIGEKERQSIRNITINEKTMEQKKQPVKARKINFIKENKKIATTANAINNLRYFNKDNSQMIKIGSTVQILAKGQYYKQIGTIKGISKAGNTATVEILTKNKKTIYNCNMDYLKVISVKTENQIAKRSMAVNKLQRI